MRQNRVGKILYATQASTNPPTIVLFTNGPELFDPPYQRYLLKFLRENTPFKEVPVKLHLRGKVKGEVPAGGWVPPSAPDAPAPPVPAGPPLDLSELEFTSTVTDDELDRASKKK